jgi:hypothetical protein
VCLWAQKTLSLLCSKLRSIEAGLSLGLDGQPTRMVQVTSIRRLLCLNAENQTTRRSGDPRCAWVSCNGVECSPACHWAWLVASSC